MRVCACVRVCVCGFYCESQLNTQIPKNMNSQKFKNPVFSKKRNLISKTYRSGARGARGRARKNGRTSDFLGTGTEM